MNGTSDHNPFVGPRPIAAGEPLFGRSADLRELFNRLQARRVVVLHSPSGAGKSSLVQAGLVPRLKEAGFDVWRVIRLNLDPAAVGLSGVSNRFALSMLASLEEELPAERRRGLAELAGLEPAAYVRTRPRRKGLGGRPIVLIFDQFEEVLTVAPRAVEQIRAFFVALGNLLEDLDCWALFAIREDHLGGLEPYREHVPTRFSNTFRLELLGLDGAREAAEGLAEVGGRAFPAAARLVADLATVSVQQADGSRASEQGRHVEPVYLQVACRRLWEAMPASDLVIDEADVAAYGDVTRALADYYREAVAQVSAGDAKVERAIREWFGQRLVVGGIRAQVRRDAELSGGLHNAVIDRLLGSYLVRADPRGGTLWYELSHDRLVAPVAADNAAWEKAHLHPVQTQARLWEEGRRAQHLLLRADAIAEASAWAELHPERLIESEREYVAESIRVRQEEARARRRLWVALGVNAVTAVAAIGASLMLVGKMGELREREVRSRDLAWERLAVEAAPDPALRIAALAEVADPLTGRWWEHTMSALSGPRVVFWAVADGAALDPSGGRVLTWRGGDPPLLWTLDGAPPVPAPAPPGVELVRAVFDADGVTLVLGYKDGAVRVWEYPTGAVTDLDTSTSPPTALAVSPGGARVLVGAADGSVRSFVRGEREGRLLTTRPEPPVATLSLDERGERVVVAFRSGVAALWEWEGGEWRWRRKLGEGPYLGAAIRGDGLDVVTAAVHGEVCVWGVAGGEVCPRVLTHHGAGRGPSGQGPGMVLSVAFDRSGERVISGSADGQVRVSRMDGGLLQVQERPAWDALDGSRHDPLPALFSPDGERFLTASADGIATLRSAAGGIAKEELAGERAPLRSAAFSADGARVLTVSERASNAQGPEVRLWDLRPTLPLRRPAATAEGGPEEGGSERRVRSRDGTHEASLRSGGGEVWISAQGTPGAPVRLPLPAPDADGLQISADGRRLLVTFASGAVQVWSTGAEPSLVLALAAGEAPLVFVELSPDGSWVFTRDDQRTAVAWDLTGAEPREAELRGFTKDEVPSLTFSPDGSSLLVTSGSGAAEVWTRRGERVDLGLDVSTACWDPGGALLVVARGDRGEGCTLEVVTADGSVRSVPPVRVARLPRPAERCSVSPGGRWAVVLDSAHRARLADLLAVGDTLALGEGDRRTQRAEFSPDGSWLLTVDEQSSPEGVPGFRVWAPGKRAPVLSRSGGLDVRFGVGGGELLVPQPDGSEQVWPLRGEVVQALVRESSILCVDPDRRRQYLGESAGEACRAYARCEAEAGRSPPPCQDGSDAGRR